MRIVNIPAQKLEEGARVVFLIQSSIIFAVMASNIHWQWTPNGYPAGLIGVGPAYGATALLARLLIWRP